MKEKMEQQPPTDVSNAPDFLYVRVTLLAYLSYRLKKFYVLARCIEFSLFLLLQTRYITWNYI